MMKRRIATSLVVILVLSMCMSAFARWNYTSNCDPRLTFSGTIAQCSLNIDANSNTSTITATLRLVQENKDGSETVTTWSGLKGTGSLMYGNTKSGTSGLYYRLEATATVTTKTGDSEIVSTSVRAKCP